MTAMDRIKELRELILYAQENELSAVDVYLDDLIPLLDCAEALEKARPALNFVVKCFPGYEDEISWGDDLELVDYSWGKSAQESISLMDAALARLGGER